MANKIFHRRSLPHYYPPEATYFITFRLYASLPKKIIEEIEISLQNQKENHFNFIKHMDGRIDEYLEKVKENRLYLKNPQLAEIVANALHHYDKKEYNLICYCIMPNHVHFVFEQKKDAISISHLMKSIKGFTAYQCNKVLDRKGQFWKHESYDHIIDSEKELNNTINYVIKNPVKAGLSDNWEDWEFSYLNPDYR